MNSNTLRINLHYIPYPNYNQLYGSYQFAHPRIPM